MKTLLTRILKSQAEILIDEVEQSAMITFPNFYVDVSFEIEEKEINHSFTHEFGVHEDIDTYKSVRVNSFTIKQHCDEKQPMPKVIVAAFLNDGAKKQMQQELIELIELELN